ncbi:CYFA0S03e02553g1_1 [Cyberlindnera fabianii]|uniref:CYFA0S03e02553g1_1 n=1 Tax=Cyberlindnera fabianii TaxID=36022 RepID=A0A061AVF8_CYBFA|nr:CYFA0S03e02553g1_1 [Cyberlindnera fabianii]
MFSDVYLNLLFKNFSKSSVCWRAERSTSTSVFPPESESTCLILSLVCSQNFAVSCSSIFHDSRKKFWKCSSKFFNTLLKNINLLERLSKEPASSLATKIVLISRSCWLQNQTSRRSWYSAPSRSMIPHALLNSDSGNGSLPFIVNSKSLNT